MKHSKCLRCGHPATWNDEMARDVAHRDHPGVFAEGEICTPCYEQIALAATISANAAARNISPQTLIKEILEKYESLD